MRLKHLILPLVLTLNLQAITVGEIPKNVIIEKDNGGVVKDSRAWNSTTLKDRVMILFYVDPDEEETNSRFSIILKEKNYDDNRVGSVAIINLAASWAPNFIINSALKEKQKEFPTTLYVNDKKKILVDEWEIEDDASNVLLFSKTGKLLFYKSGALSDDDMNEALKIIEENQ